ncbi:MAG: hypothetical protein K0R99_4913 [Microbacterium sp.]|nr:hypothetical protein [Microbacterium sp.]
MYDSECVHEVTCRVGSARNAPRLIGETTALRLTSIGPNSETEAAYREAAGECVEGKGGRMSRRRRAHRRRYEDAQEPFLLREYGGAPMWMLLGAAVIAIAVAVFALVHFMV